MKNALLRTTPLILTMVLGVGLIHAEESPLAKPLRKFDRNKDGKLTGDEVVLARQAFNRGGRELDNGGRPNPEFLQRRQRSWREQNMTFLDLNGNGSLEDDEKKRADTVWEAIAARQENLRVELLLKYDTNDDGELNDEERRASRNESETKRREIEKQVMAAHPKPTSPPN